MTYRTAGLKKYRVSIIPKGRGKAREFNIVGVATYTRPVYVYDDPDSVATGALWGIASDDGTPVFECLMHDLEFCTIIEHLNDLAVVRGINDKGKSGRAGKPGGGDNSPDGLPR